ERHRLECIEAVFSKHLLGRAQLTSHASVWLDVLENTRARQVRLGAQEPRIGLDWPRKLGAVESTDNGCHVSHSAAAPCSSQTIHREMQRRSAADAVRRLQAFSGVQGDHRRTA